MNETPFQAIAHCHLHEMRISLVSSLHSLQVQRLIIGHAGSEQIFISNAYVRFKFHQTTGYYHNDMNCEELTEAVATEACYKSTPTEPFGDIGIVLHTSAPSSVVFHHQTGRGNHHDILTEC
jgi:hypothetical protein